MDKEIKKGGSIESTSNESGSKIGIDLKAEKSKILKEATELIKESGENLLPQEQVAELRGEISEIIEVDEASIERTKKILDRAKLIERLDSDEDLSDDERSKLGMYLHERGWHAVFSEPKAGDKLVYFSSPGGEFSVKSFNTIFGEQATDDFIAKRGEVLLKTMESRGLNALNQDYRSGVFKLDASKTVDNFEEIMNKVGDEVNKEMSDFVQGMIDSMISSGNPSEKYTQLIKLLDKDSGGLGFRMNFGSSTVGEQKGENDLSNIISTLTECAQMSQISRRSEGINYGNEFSSDLIISEISEINELGQDLTESSVQDSQGINYKVFSEIGGRRVLNRDLLRLIRKGEFKSLNGSKEIVKKVEQYIRRINLLDLVKPITAEEVQNGVVKEKVQKLDRFLEKDSNGKSILKKEINSDDKKILSDELHKDQKDSRYDSSEFFHKEAMRFDDCIYVNVDVLDLGVDLLLEYEHLLQDIINNPEELQKISIEAGDRITENMRAIRGNAIDVFGDYFPGIKPTIKPGGDEISFAIENMVDAKRMEEFLLDLQKSTGTRVIKTVVGTAERQSSKDDKDNTDDRLVEHLSAIKRSERGSDLCKKIEKNIRTLELLLENKIVSSDDKNKEESIKIVNKEIEDIGIARFKNIAIKENYDGDFLVICRDADSGEIEEIPFDNVFNLIDKQINEINK